MGELERKVLWQGVNVERRSRLELPIAVFGPCELRVRYTLAGFMIHLGATHGDRELPGRDRPPLADWGAEKVFDAPFAGTVQLYFDNSASIIRGKTLTSLEVRVRGEPAEAVPADALGMPPEETLTMASGNKHSPNARAQIHALHARACIESVTAHSMPGRRRPVASSGCGEQPPTARPPIYFVSPEGRSATQRRRSPDSPRTLNGGALNPLSGGAASPEAHSWQRATTLPVLRSPECGCADVPSFSHVWLMPRVQDRGGAGAAARVRA